MISTDPTSIATDPMSGLAGEEFIGIFKALQADDSTESMTAGDVLDDMEGEQETLPPSEDTNEGGTVDDVDTDSELLATLQGASKGVTEGTDGEYRR